jgi:hypothetical protein
MGNLTLASIADLFILINDIALIFCISTAQQIYHLKKYYHNFIHSLIQTNTLFTSPEKYFTQQQAMTSA